MKKTNISIGIILLVIFLSIPIKAAEIPVARGEYIELGKIYKDPILWRVIDIDEDGNLLLLSDKILILRSYDSSSINTEFDMGPSWEESSIRSWLNGSEGFLKEENFSKEERDLIKTSRVKNLLIEGDGKKPVGGKKYYYNELSPVDMSFKDLVNGYEDSYYNLLEDKVFLLDVMEAYKLYNNFPQGSDEFPYYAGIPTKKARITAPKNEMNLHSKTLSYWLRTRRGNNGAYYVEPVMQDYESTDVSIMNLNSIEGVRPAFKIEGNKLNVKSGSGKANQPYKIDLSKNIGSDKPSKVKEYDFRPNTSKVVLDGQVMDLPAYNNGQYNYLKLRDIGEILKNTDKKFDLVWDPSKKSIEIIRGKEYVSVGNELERILTNARGIKSDSLIYLDGKKLDLEAYNIKSNNYVKLRDVMDILQVEVDWIKETNQIILNTK